METDDKMGTIVTIQAERGFFFVRGSDGKDYFAHKSTLQNGVRIGQLQIGDACLFKPEPSPKGPRCAIVTVDRLPDDPMSEIFT